MLFWRKTQQSASVGAISSGLKLALSLHTSQHQASKIHVNSLAVSHIAFNINYENCMAHQIKTR